MACQSWSFIFGDGLDIVWMAQQLTVLVNQIGLVCDFGATSSNLIWLTYLISNFELGKPQSKFQSSFETSSWWGTWAAVPATPSLFSASTDYCPLLDYLQLSAHLSSAQSLLEHPILRGRTVISCWTRCCLAALPLPCLCTQSEVQLWSCDTFGMPVDAALTPSGPDAPGSDAAKSGGPHTSITGHTRICLQGWRSS
jgi:hypothetical protein